MSGSIWQEEQPVSPFVVPDDVLDLVFRIDVRCLPLDHAYALSQAILIRLPWLADEPQAGIHLIHGAESGNGWQRPRHPERELLHLSRRARLALRVPKHRVTQARSLTGQVLDLAGYTVTVGQATTRPLSPLTTLFARHVMTSPPTTSEEQFLDHIGQELQQRRIRVRKLLCGRAHRLQLPDGHIAARSVLLADLTQPASVDLQQNGLGPGRRLGCGLFLPHKGIAAVNEQNG